MFPACVQSIVEEMMQDFHVDPSNEPKLRLFINRSVFPVIHSDIYPPPDPSMTALLPAKLRSHMRIGSCVGLVM